jgi:RNA polymerase sigma-70 factor (ECF subfamily)
VRTVLRVDDIEIIKSFQDGNLGAFDEVVAEFREPLTRHAIRRLNDTSTAEDAVQETFVRAFKSFDRLHEASRIGPWLHHILANVCIDEANRRRRDIEKTERASSDPFAHRSSPSAEQLLGLDHDTAPLADAMGSLPTSYQEALQLRFVDELSYEEMAVAAGTTEQNVRARVSRARSAIKVALRGVAVLPALLVGIVLKRGTKSAALAERAVERAETTQKLASSAETGIVVSKFATQIAPAVEAVNTLAISAQSSAPAISKAAIGIGALAMAAVSANPERSNVIPPAPAAIVVQVEEPVDAPSADLLAPTPAASGSQSASDQTLRLAAQPPDSSSIESSYGDAESSDISQDGTAVVRPAVEPVPSGESSAGSPTDSATNEDAPTADDPATATPAPVVLRGGTATATSVAYTQIGVRTDLSGQFTLVVDGIPTLASFTGRWSIDADVDRTGGHRLSGVITLQLGGSAVEIRLAGHARAAASSSVSVASSDGADAETGTDTSDSVPAPSARSISGMFRISNGAMAGLVDSGSFTGSFDPQTLVLRLTP